MELHRAPVPAGPGYPRRQLDFPGGEAGPLSRRVRRSGLHKGNISSQVGGLYASGDLRRGEWPPVIALLLLVPVLAVAAVPNYQIFNAYIVWADRQFDLQWGGTTLPTTWLMTLDAVVTVVLLALAPLFYRWLGKRRSEPDEIAKLVIGPVFSVAGMLCLYLAAATQLPGEKITLAWALAFHLVNGVAFVHLFPVSLALFSKLAPSAVNATLIGVYFLALFAGYGLVGWVGSLFEQMPATRFWLLHGAFAAASGAAFLLFRFLPGLRAPLKSG